MELNPINIENIEMKDDIHLQKAIFITDIEDVVNDAVVKKPLDKTR